jgi:hypothetical protein
MKLDTKTKVSIILGAIVSCGMAIELLGLTSSSKATAASGPIKIIHQPPDVRSLPVTSDFMTISVSVENTRDTDLKVRLVGARDGRFLDVMLPAGQFNTEDLPTYEVKIPAPAAVFSYQFIVHQPDGSLVPSRRFTVQRPCVQNYKVDVSNEGNDASIRREMAELVARQSQLARDVKDYEAALKIIDDLKTSVPSDGDA